MVGVMAAGEWAKDGALIEYKANADMSQDVAEVAAQFRATVSMVFDSLSGSFTQSGMNWTPPHGWAFSGGDTTVAVGGGKGVFVETAKADFNKLFAALVGR
jgi:roadblock/LC7 domain-containing protein